MKKIYSIWFSLITTKIACIAFFFCLLMTTSLTFSMNSDAESFFNDYDLNNDLKLVPTDNNTPFVLQEDEENNEDDKDETQDEEEDEAIEEDDEDRSSQPTPLTPARTPRIYNNELIPLTPARTLLIYSEETELNKHYRSVKANEWHSIRNRKYSVTCPCCNEPIRADDISQFIKQIHKHTNNKKHKNINKEDLLENYHKELKYDLVARCIDCPYVCNTKYYTFAGAYKAIWTHRKNKHKLQPRLSRTDVDKNIRDSKCTKKYIMIRKTINKKHRGKNEKYKD